VDGFINELASLVQNYYADNIYEVKKLGMSYSHLGYLSRVSVSDNAEKLFDDLLQIYYEKKKPILLIGHSMGGAEALYTVLRHPELMLNGYVEKVVLIEAAIGGSPLAENLKGSLMGKAIEIGFGEGLESLRTDVANQKFSKAYSDFLKWVSPAQVAELSKNVYYSRGSVADSKNLSLGVRLIRSFCKSGVLDGTENDGILTTDAQILNFEPKFGTDLGVVQEDTDHITWVVGGFWTRGMKSKEEPFRGHSRSTKSHAYTRALLGTIYQEQTAKSAILKKNDRIIDQVAQ
jgi:hypothetical protein